MKPSDEKSASWLRKYWPLILIGFFIFVCGIMLLVYRIKFGSGLSDHPDEWGAFGDYLGSITGLLAFLGVLYTAWESRKSAEKSDERAEKAELRAEKAEQDALKREEREVFFNLLQLHNSNTNEVTCVIEDHIFQGQKAFDKYVNVVNNIIADCIIVETIRKRDEDKLKQIIHTYNYDEFDEKVCALCSYIDQEFCEGINGYYEAISFKNVKECVSENGFKLLMHKRLDYKAIRNDLGYTILNSYFGRKDYDAIYNLLKFVGNKLYDNAGYAFSQYFRNMFYLLKYINNLNYIDKELYFNTFRAQLSRSEIIICLVNSVSDKTSNNFVKLISDNEILDDLYFNDFLLTTDEEIWKGNELDFINGVLDKCLADN